jgi:UDP-glucose 4-epimerase
MGSEFKHACVTGGAGFIGSHLVEALLRKRIAVTVLDNLSVGRRENVPSSVSIVEGDILDTELATETLSGCDVVFHLAARVAIRSSFEFAVQDTMTNVAGTASVLRAARNAGSVRKVITASSMAVYGDTPDQEPFPESLDTAPISPYGVSKLAAERLTHLMCCEAGMQSAVLRLFNTYGPRQALSPYVGVITIFINKLLSKERPTIYGDGEQCRDFVHVQDVASAFVRAMHADISGETFNIGSGAPRTINEVLNSLNKLMDAEIAPQYVEAVPGELRYSVADISKAQRLLGYEPTHNFDSSLKDLIGEFQSKTLC